MVKLIVPGDPQPCERARRGARGGWYLPPKTRAYEEAVGWAWRAAGVGAFGGQALTFSASFHIARPAAHFGTGRNAQTLRSSAVAAVPPGDLDNYCKSVLDGLQVAGAFVNDKQVVCFSGVHKYWASPGDARTEVRLWAASLPVLEAAA